MCQELQPQNNPAFYSWHLKVDSISRFLLSPGKSRFNACITLNASEWNLLWVGALTILAKANLAGIQWIQQKMFFFFFLFLHVVINSQKQKGKWQDRNPNRSRKRIVCHVVQWHCVPSLFVLQAVCEPKKQAPWWKCKETAVRSNGQLQQLHACVQLCCKSALG